ncbi:hypothetical protein AAY473_030869 [Plecturocebus cupreus]
MLAKVVSKA